MEQNLSIYISLLNRSFSDHYLRCGGWLNLEFSKRDKHSGWVIKTGDSPVNRGIPLNDAIREKAIFHTSFSSRSSFFQSMCMMYCVN